VPTTVGLQQWVYNGCTVRFVYRRFEYSFVFMGCHLCQKSAHCNIYKCEANIYKCTVTFVYVRPHLYLYHVAWADEKYRHSIYLPYTLAKPLIFQYTLGCMVAKQHLSKLSLVKNNFRQSL